MVSASGRAAWPRLGCAAPTLSAAAGGPTTTLWLGRRSARGSVASTWTSDNWFRATRTPLNRYGYAPNRQERAVPAGHWAGGPAGGSGPGDWCL